MTVRTTRFAVGLVVCLVMPSLAADTLKDVEKKIVDQWESIKTLSATMTMTIHAGAPEPLKSTGSLEYYNDNGVDKKRMTMAFNSGAPGQTEPISQTIIFDGEFAWTIREADGKQVVAKQRPDAMEGTPGGKQTFEQLHETFDLTLLPDATMNDKASYVIASVPKKPGSRGIGKYNFFIAKDSGILFKTVGYNGDGEVVTDIEFSDIKINPTLDADRFVFEGSPETKVLDMTKER